MAIPIKCAGCQAAFDVPDNLAGKTIRCTSCKSQVTVASAAPAAPAKAAPVAKPAAKKIEVDDDDVKTKPGKAKDAKDTKVKSAAARRRDEDDDDDEEDDDRPRKKGKAKAAAKGGGGMIALIAIGAVGICAIIGVSVYLLMGSGSDDKKKDTASSGSPSSPSTPPGGSLGPPAGGSQGPAAGGGASSNWVKVQGEGFTCEMPSQPKSMNQGGQSLQVLERNNGTEAFCASVVDLGPGSESVTSNSNQRSALFNKMSEGALQGMNQMGGGVSFRMNGSKDTTQDGLPAREMNLSASGRAKANGTMRMVAGRSKVYLFFWIGSGGDSDSQTFFASIKIAEGSGGIAMGGPNAPGGGSLGPAPGGANPGTPGVGSLPPPGGGVGPGTPGVGTLPPPGGGGSLGPAPGGANPGMPGVGTLPPPGGGSLGPVPGMPPPGGMNPGAGGAGAGGTPPPPAPPPLPGGGSSLGPVPGGPVPGGPGPGGLGPQPGGVGPLPGGIGPMPGGVGPGSLGPVPGGAGSLGPVPGGGGLNPGGNGQSGGGQDRPPQGAAVRPQLSHKLGSFYAVAFDAANGDFFTIAARVDPKNPARKLGELRRHGYPDFKEKAVFHIPNLATRAVIDPNRGLLFAAAATNQGEMRTLESLELDRANAYGDVQVYDLKPIRDGKVADGADLKPVGSINLNASIRGLELSNDGKHLFVAVNKAVPGGTPKTYIRQYEASDRKFIKEFSLGEQALDMRKNADGNQLVGFEYDTTGRKPSVSILTFDMTSLEVKKLRSPGVVTDYTTRSNGSAMFAVLGQADRNGARPGQLHAADAAGDVNMIGTTAWKASNNNYVRFSPDGSHLFATSFANRDTRGNLQNAGLDVYATDAKEAGGYKKIASIRDAIRVTSSVPVGGYFDVSPDGSHVLFHNGAVLAVKNIDKNAEGSDKVPEPGGNPGGGPGAGGSGAGGFVPGAGGGLGVPPMPGGGVGPAPGGGLGVPPMPGGGLGVPPMPGGGAPLPGPGGASLPPPMPGGGAPLPGPGGASLPPPMPGGGAPLPGGGAPPSLPPKPPGM
jgi:hypothetical protein